VTAALYHQERELS